MGELPTAPGGRFQGLYHFQVVLFEIFISKGSYDPCGGAANINPLIAMAKRDNDGFIYEDAEALSEEDEQVLQGLKQQHRVDPVTGRKQKPINILNKKSLNPHEMDEFFLDF